MIGPKFVAKSGTSKTLFFSFDVNESKIIAPVAELCVSIAPRSIKNAVRGGDFDRVLSMIFIAFQMIQQLMFKRERWIGECGARETGGGGFVPHHSPQPNCSVLPTQGSQSVESV